MSGKMKEFLLRKKTLIIPFVLNIILCTSLFSVYQIPFLSLWTLGIIAVSFIMYAFCEFINKHNFIGGIIFIFVFFFDMSVFIRLIAGYDYGQSFQQWFLTGADQVDTQFNYLLALLISFPPFFSVVTYYFTNVLYRMSFLTLTSLIPCAVYVKVLSEINNVYICLIAILNVAILMINVRTEQNKNAKTVGMPAAVLSACVFAFILLVVSAAIPKEEEARYYDRFEELFMDTNRNIQMNMDYSIFSEFSGNADAYRGFTGRRMYTLYGDKVPYFKRQNFDYYDFALDHWSGDEYYSEPYYTDMEWSSEAELMSLAELQKAFKAAEGYEEGFAGKYNLGRITEYAQLEDPIKDVYVQPENFGAIYYLTPARAISAAPYRAFGESEQIYVTGSGVFRNLENAHKPNQMYVVRLFDEYAARFYWFELGGANIDNDTCGVMLEDLKGILERNNDPLAKNVEAFLNVHRFAEDYRARTEANTALISEKIKALAEQITVNCVYDWQKANELQNYFINNGYIYDLEYVSSDTSPEYFLFNSKRGSCSDYASAYVLMARSLGLTARYTEGFSPDVTSQEGEFIIRDSSSHAYPEVYIQNMGWIVFEPTVPSEYSGIVETDDVTGAITIDYRLLLAMFAIAGVILAGVLAGTVLYPVINERQFIKRAKNSAPDECIKMVYGRFSEKRLAKLVKRVEAHTPYEASKAFEKLTGCDITELAFMLEKVAYGGENADENEKTAALNCYDIAVNAAKEYKKSRNKTRRKMMKK